MKSMILSLLVLILSLFLSPQHLQAQSTQNFDFTTSYTLKTVPLAFGGAYRALADSNAAILINPAGLAQRKGKVILSGEYLGNSWIDSDMFSASVADYQALSFMAVGLSYDRDNFSVGGNDVEVQQVTGAAAMDFGNFLYVGAALKGYFSEIKGPLLQGPKGMDADFGALLRPLPFLAVAATLQNAFVGNTRDTFPMKMGFGTALILEGTGRIAVDFDYNFETVSNDKLNAYFGGELAVTEGIYLRSGFGLDNVNSNNFYSLGLQISGPKLGLGFTFSQRLNPTSETFAGVVEGYF